MNIKLGIYRNNVDFLNMLWDRDPTQTVNDFVSRAALATGVPCIVVAHYLGEHIGFTDDVNKKIKNLMEFYGYENVEE